MGAARLTSGGSAPEVSVPGSTVGPGRCQPRRPQRATKRPARTRQGVVSQPWLTCAPQQRNPYGDASAITDYPVSRIYIAEDVRVAELREMLSFDLITPYDR